MLIPTNIKVVSTIEEVRTTEVEPRGLAYWAPIEGRREVDGSVINQKMTPEDLREVLVEAKSKDNRFAGTRTSYLMNDWIIDRTAQSEALIDEAYERGFNTLRYYPGVGIFWGQSLAHSTLTLREAVVGLDILIAVIQGTNTYRHEHMAEHQLNAYLKRFLRDAVATRTIIDGHVSSEGTGGLDISWRIFSEVFGFKVMAPIPSITLAEALAGGYSYTEATTEGGRNILRSLPVLYPRICKYDENKWYVNINDYWVRI